MPGPPQPLSPPMVVGRYARSVGRRVRRAASSRGRASKESGAYRGKQAGRQARGHLYIARRRLRADSQHSRCVTPSTWGHARISLDSPVTAVSMVVPLSVAPAATTTTRGFQSPTPAERKFERTIEQAQRAIVYPASMDRVTSLPMVTSPPTSDYPSDGHRLPSAWTNVSGQLPVDTVVTNVSSPAIYRRGEALQSIYLGYLWLSLLIGLPGNILIAVVYVVIRHKRTCDWFIFYLSVYDCAVCLFAVPLYLSIETGVWESTGSDLACKLEQFIIFTSQFSSVLILGIIAVDRIDWAPHCSQSTQSEYVSPATLHKNPPPTRALLV
ncbi:hypothetical protein RRG08_005360 [Elysia crispata]|uniref:G-protein coupled receptors family 1 profile domain-containing protein n=1 Tax=Elysia crispata TaxID=231223 RepID=A0AAE1ADF2_9GAST|nr:hypothetical protein RRG08_005360 [Elysia crispata]